MGGEARHGGWTYGPQPFRAYIAGVQVSGVLCGGPNLAGGRFYDGEGGRFVHGERGPPPYPPEPPIPAPPPSVGNVFGDINDVARDLQEACDEAKRFLRPSPGRCASTGFLTGALVTAVTRDPACLTRAQKASTRFLAFAFGCGAGAARKLP